MQSPFKHYLARVGAVLVGALLLVWLYVAAMPMAYFEGGYPAWIAKSEMLAGCRLGQVAFFGDSRLEGGVMPALLPVPASNFGVAAGTAVETRSAVQRAMDCKTPPREAVISLSSEHFGPLSEYFWLLSVRYGFIGPGELWATERLARSLGDTASFSTPTPDGLSGPVRDWLYALRFPSLSFSSLVQGRVFGRYASNEARLASVLQAGGWSEYGGHPGAPPPVRPPFVATKLQTAEFEAALARLRDRGVPVRLLVMPASETERHNPAAERAYLDYLTDVTRRFPGVELISATIPRWPAGLFADGVHLNGAGAKLFSERLASCMGSGTLEPGCDLDWHGQTASE